VRYRGYARCKPTGIDWLCRVPAHWPTPPLYTRYFVDLGKMLHEGRITGEHLLPYLRNVDVQWGSINFDELPEMDVSPSERERFTIRPGDLLVCEGGEIGRAAIVPGIETEVAFQKALHRMRPRNADDLPRFMFYMMYSACQQGIFVAGGNPNTIPHLTGEKLRRYRFPAPPQEEQRAIAGFLDRETAKLDTLVAKKRALIEKLKEKRTALISRTVTRGLPPDAARAAGFDPHPNLEPSGIDWLGEVPEHWEVTRLKHIANVRQGVTKGRDLTGHRTIELPYLRVANVQDGYLDLSEMATIEILPTELDRFRLKRGDVLMNEGGDNDKLGRGAVWSGEIDRCLHQNHVFSVRPKDVRRSDWIALWTQGCTAKTYFLLRAKQTTNLASISSSNIKELPLAIPPESEEAAIADFLDRETAKIDRMVAKVEEAIERLREYRSALITAAVTGKIDVRGVGAGLGSAVPVESAAEALP
jgi:type I restriction enzyme, S subunit